MPKCERFLQEALIAPTRSHPCLVPLWGQTLIVGCSDCWSMGIYTASVHPLLHCAPQANYPRREAMISMKARNRYSSARDESFDATNSGEMAPTSNVAVS